MTSADIYSPLKIMNKSIGYKKCLQAFNMNLAMAPQKRIEPYFLTKKYEYWLLFGQIIFVMYIKILRVCFI